MIAMGRSQYASRGEKRSENTVGSASLPQLFPSSSNQSVPEHGTFVEMEIPMKMKTRMLVTALLASSVMPAAAFASPTVTLVRWHGIMQQANADDHTPGVGIGEQGGPVRNARAFAMTQLAVYDAVNSITKQNKQYNAIGLAPAGASLDAAIACAAHGVLVNVYSTFTATFDAALAADLGSLGASQSTTDGCDIGETSAAAMIARRVGDGSEIGEVAPGGGGATGTGGTNFAGLPVNGPRTGVTFQWSADPIAQQGVAIGSHWGAVTPFILENGAQFRAPAPPVPGSPEYVTGWNMAAQVGQSPLVASSIPNTSTAAKRFVGNFWGYDGQPLLGTPPRLYSQIAIQVALEKGLTDTSELARFLAVLHAGMADAGVAAWDSKYFYDYWRPVTGVRADDGVANTPSDAGWTPVGQSIANSASGAPAIQVTPPFPAYPSGHATFGSVMANVLVKFFGDGSPFTFVSDEYDGVSTDPFTPGVPRPLVPVRFAKFSDAKAENGISRIYNGVHWQWDNIEGQKIGKSIVHYMLGTSGEFKKK